MKLRACILIGLSLLTLSGCVFESESSCFSRLRGELDQDYKSYTDLAYNIPEGSGSTQGDFLNAAINALSENLNLSVMYENENINVCDYFLLYSRLTKKG